MANTRATTTTNVVDDKTAVVGADESISNAPAKADEPVVKAKAKPAKADEPAATPHPTQAELDAMKEGRFHSSDRQVTASDSDEIAYRTR